MYLLLKGGAAFFEVSQMQRSALSEGCAGQGLVLVVGRLSLMPGVLQQRDAKYRVPLALAQQLRRQDLIEVVFWAAA